MESESIVRTPFVARPVPEGAASAPLRASSEDPPEATPGVAAKPRVPDRGLRSPLAIRWLLVAGASVVAVSVVRLVASEWGQLVPAVQYLLLVLGAMAVYGAGDVIRHRLRLPVAGAALLALYSVLVPLLAWAAGRQQLLGSPAGVLAAGLGIGALLSPLPRLLRSTLGYRGRWLVPALATFLFAIPVLPRLEKMVEPASRGGFFLWLALGLGLLLRAASRHLNRELFHRSRLQAGRRSLHLLPFIALSSFYVMACASLGAFGTMLAVPLALVGLAAIDTGEEFHHAASRALGEPLERWPRFTRALLATGFALVVSSMVLSLVDFSARSAALVMLLVAVRLLGWAGRYASAFSLAGGLLSGTVAYHLLPSLVPEALRELYGVLLTALGWVSTGAAIGLGDVGLMAAIGVGAVLSRRHLTEAMSNVFYTAMTLASFLVLWPAMTEPAALAVLVVPVVVLLVAALRISRTPMPLVGIHPALALGSVAWIHELTGSTGNLFGQAELLALALLNAAWFLLAMRFLGRLPATPDDAQTTHPTTTWHLRGTRTWHRLALGPALLLAVLLCPLAPGMTPWAGALVAAAAGVVLSSASRVAPILGAETELLQIFSAALLALATPSLLIFGGFHDGLWSTTQTAMLCLVTAVLLRVLAARAFRRHFDTCRADGRSTMIAVASVNEAHTIVTVASTLFALLAGILSLGADGGAAATPWLPLVPAFLTSAFFALLARASEKPWPAALVAAGLFVTSTSLTIGRLPHLTRELYCLGPGFALLALAALLRPRIGPRWTGRLFTAGAVSLYAMPVWGLLGEVAWGWQVVLLVFAIAFGALAFQVRSRSLLLASSAALLIDLGFFLVELRQQAPSLVWVLGIVFGLALMALAAWIEHRRESLLQRLRIWGDELRAWS